MGILSYAVAGGGFAVIGAWESLDSSNFDPNPSPDSSSSPMSQITSSSSSPPLKPIGSSSSISVALFSSLFIINSIFTFFSSIGSRDRVGSMTQLQILAIAALFLIYSIVTYLVNNSQNAAFNTLPSSITTLLLLFGFIEEFLMFYLQKKDVSGIENRYYDLMLVPITICVFSTILELKSNSNIHRFAKLGRGIGLILQGTWFLQMGVTFFTDLITHNCTFHEKSRGNFTIKCKAHSDYHRAKAIATLQFNCHLALMVVLATGLFSVIAKKKGYLSEEGEDHSKYRPLGAAEMANLSNFTLDSDEEDNEIREEGNVVAKEAGLNGIGSHN